MCITMDQLKKCASLSHTHYWYGVGMLKVLAIICYINSGIVNCQATYQGRSRMAPTIIQLTSAVKLVAGETWVLSSLGVTLVTLGWSLGGRVPDGTHGRRPETVPEVVSVYFTNYCNGVPVFFRA